MPAVMYPRRLFFIISTLLTLVSCFVILKIFPAFPMIRGLMGDFLVVVFLYSFFKIFRDFNPWRLGIFILLFSFIVEGLQALHLNQYFAMENNFIWNIILGSTFDVLDLLAYLAGVMVITSLDILSKRKGLPRQKKIDKV